jgi:hypothetical protein
MKAALSSKICFIQVCLNTLFVMVVPVIAYFHPQISIPSSIIDQTKIKSRALVESDSDSD